MPMQLTVNRNCKTSENYNSEGQGISLTVELDQTCSTDPPTYRIRSPSCTPGRRGPGATGQ